MAAYRQVDGLKAACGLTACTWDQLRAQHSVTSMGEPGMVEVQFSIMCDFIFSFDICEMLHGE